jgi:hypothetical protein
VPTVAAIKPFREFLRRAALWSTCAHAAAAVIPGPPVMHFVLGPSPGSSTANSQAAADCTTATIYYAPPLDAFARGHEAGHLFDCQVLSDGDRHYFQRVMHAPSGVWDQGTGIPDGVHSPSEWFADYYAAAAIHLDLSRSIVSSYAPLAPTRLKRVSRALERLGKRQHLQPYARSSAARCRLAIATRRGAGVTCAASISMARHSGRTASLEIGQRTPIPRRRAVG